MPDDQLGPPPGDSSNLLDVFGSDIEDDDQEHTRSSRVSRKGSQEDPDDVVLARDKTRSQDDFRPKPRANPEDEIRPQDDFRPSADVEQPGRVPRRKEQPDPAPRRQTVMDSLEADDYEDEEAFSSKKRKKDRPSSSKSKKQRVASDDDEPKRRKHDDDFIDDDDVEQEPEDKDDVVRTEGGLGIGKDIEDDDPQEQDEAPAKKKMTAFEEALEQTKSMRRTRRKEMDYEKVEADCVTFIERMVKARDEDLDCYKRGKPALSKLRMLRDVERMTTKVTHREALIDNGLLSVCKVWLDPMPDGTLPNVQIRTSLLNILSQVRIGDNWVERLKNSMGLGRVVHFLSKNDDYLPNRRLAERLMNRWSRPIYQSNSDFGDLLSEYDRPDQGYRARPDSLAAERRRAREAARQFKSARDKLEEMRGSDEPRREQVLAPIPKKSAFLYTALAEGTAKVDEKVQREHRAQAQTSRKVNRTMTKMRTLNKNRSARAAKPSVNGRNINM